MADGLEGDWSNPIIAITTVFIILVGIALALRIFTRLYIVRSFWWDDFTIILAVIGTTIGSSFNYVEVHYGFGKHERFLPGGYARQYRKYAYGEWMQTFATLMWTKVSICLFLMRLPNGKRLLPTLQCAVAFLILSNTVLTTMWIMQCQPTHAVWDSEGVCLSRAGKEGIVLTQAIISAISDFSFATVPILILWRVQIDFKTKIELWLLMCLGFITGACCIVRTALNREALPLDETYDGIVNWMWRLFEVQIGIIAACIPTFRPLYLWIMRHLRGDAPVLDTNIKLPLNERDHSWAEKSDEPSSLESGNTKDTHVDAMRDELVKEGILRGEGNGINNHSAPNVLCSRDFVESERQDV